MDRNVPGHWEKANGKESPSSRRAWIEIASLYMKFGFLRVALLAEGVDRNKLTYGTVEDLPWSPSSRRAWIEITTTSALRAWN